ncbi:DUF2326 domain-containing protein [Archaeoglobus veneficus]|uniref:DUF2326 domain-containing protein n=1 Tax=Archaeoglobus veneficus (strain DSM 11195 / SNP6) TaxID=693661 RepID=F2KSC7_ARCVS|nr:DUF2326 domain-containing protein [Archaeoglobus veneficus]AEA46896.1 Protein of unknown function DUF2326 [Archaeoglobus veneficus SNP6]
MIKRVRCDRPSFRTVEFKEGFNVVLADRTETSSEKDSRNGLGKTTLVEIIHFCLGSTLQKGSVLKSKELENWTFILDLTLNGRDYSVYRNTSNPSKVELEGDFSDWPVKPTRNWLEGTHSLKVDVWRKVLGFLMFDLSIDIYDKWKYAPTFRSLISYFARRSEIAFRDPFKHHPKQREWDIQVNNAYLLGLNWEYASEFQILKDQERTLKELKKAATEGLLTGYIGTLGELEAERVRLESEIQKLEEELNSFRVHPQYAEIEKEANMLTEKIHRITNRLILAKKILSQYRKSIETEKDVPIELVERVYREAGLWFTDKLKMRLEDVKRFHEQIVANRRDYLRNEIDKLERQIESYKNEIKKLTDARAKLFEILKTHRALDEYRLLYERLIERKQQLKEIINSIENLKKFEDGLNDLKIKRLELFKRARQDLEERKYVVEKAINQFNRNSQFLYSEPGMLSIDITESGYKFKVEIKRAKSEGIERMKVFCYDLMLIQLRANQKDKPGFLIHDSTIFNGVDERQVARAMELAAMEAKERGFQYICAINSDSVPHNEFSKDFRNVFKESIRGSVKITKNK